MKKCEWSNYGVCEFYGTVEEQEANENEYACDGTEDEQKLCGMIEEGSEKGGI